MKINTLNVIGKRAKMVQNLTFLHLFAYINDNRETLPPLFIRGIYKACCIAVGILIAAFALSAVSTSFGAIAASLVMQLGTAIALVIFAGIGLVLLRASFLAWAEVLAYVPTEKPTQKVLQSRVTVDAGADKLVYLFADETREQFAQRAKDVVKNHVSGAIWAAIIEPQNHVVQIKTGSAETDYFFKRGQEPFFPERNEDQKHITSMDHSSENYDMYMKYVRWFSYHFQRWSIGAKLEANKAKASDIHLEIIAEKARAAAVCFALLVFALPVFGQSKTRQVDEALGTRIREIPKDGEKLAFVFNESGKQRYYYREGDGKSEYTELLKQTKGMAAFNDQGGELVKIEKAGETVFEQGGRHVFVNKIPDPIGPKGEVYHTHSTTGDPARPRYLPGKEEIENTPKTGERIDFSIDSSEIDAAFDSATNVFDQAVDNAWKVIKPFWKFVMHCFFALIPIAILVAFIFRYYSSTAKTERFYGIGWIGRFIRRVHETSSGVTLIVCWVVTTVLLIDQFMYFVYVGIPVWALLGTALPTFWVAEWLTNKFVPNPPGPTVADKGNDNGRYLTAGKG